MSERTRKKFAMLASDIEEIATGYGSCLASDMITVGGLKVGYMYRKRPRDEHDSGWSFFGGQESDAYTSDASNFEIYDVNTIANYDRDVVPLLDTPAPCAFERNSATNNFVAVTPTFDA